MPNRTRMAVDVPETLQEALSPAWLSAALGVRFPGITITDVHPGPVESRVSTNARFRIECADGVPEGLSADLCLKGYFGNPRSRQAGVAETYFYRDMVHSLGLRTLRSVYADLDPVTHNGAVITEDMVAAGGTFLNCMSAYDPNRAAETLSQLAKLHGATWNSPAWADTAWLAPRMANSLKARGLPEIRSNFEGPIGAGVPKQARDAQRLVDAYRTLAAQVAGTRPWTVVHGDSHVGNVFLDAAGRPSFLDWQLAQRGAWYIDVGYHIASCLTTEDRRSNERDLLRHYLDELGSLGVDPPSWDAAWTGLRRGLVHGYFLWGITQLVDPAVTTVLLQRLGTAAADHDSLAALEGI